MNITLIGMPGSGKSHIGKELSEKTRCTLIELDKIMEADYKMPLHQILDKIGETAFLEEQEKDAILHTNTQTNIVVSPGGSIVYSNKAMQHLQKISKIIYLKTSLDTVKKRISGSPRGIVGLKDKTLKQLYRDRILLYDKWADITIDAERDTNKIINDIMKSLEHI